MSKAVCWRCGHEDEQDFSNEEEATRLIQTRIFDDFLCVLCLTCYKESEERFLRNVAYEKEQTLLFRIDCLRAFASRCEYTTPNMQIAHIQKFEAIVAETWKEIGECHQEMWKVAKSFLMEMGLGHGHARLEDEDDDFS